MRSSTQAGAANDPDASAWQILHDTASSRLHPILRDRGNWFYEIPIPPCPLAEFGERTDTLRLDQDKLGNQAAAETKTLRKKDLEREHSLIGQVQDAISTRIPNERAWYKFNTVDLFAQSMDSTYIRTFQASSIDACDRLSSAARQSLAVSRLSNLLVSTVARLRSITLFEISVGQII